jgi:hypothetical protein
MKKNENSYQLNHIQISCRLLSMNHPTDYDLSSLSFASTFRFSEMVAERSMTSRPSVHSLVVIFITSSLALKWIGEFAMNTVAERKQGILTLYPPLFHDLGSDIAVDSSNCSQKELAHVHHSPIYVHISSLFCKCSKHTGCSSCLQSPHYKPRNHQIS